MNHSVRTHAPGSAVRSFCGRRRTGHPDYHNDDGYPGLPRRLRRSRVAGHRHRQLRLFLVRDAAEGHEAGACERRRRRPEQPSGGATGRDRSVLLVGGGVALSGGGTPSAHIGMGALPLHHIFCPGSPRMRMVGWCGDTAFFVRLRSRP